MGLWRIAILILVAWLGWQGFAGMGYAHAPANADVLVIHGSRHLPPPGMHVPRRGEAELRATPFAFDLLACQGADSGPSGELGPAKLRIRALRVVDVGSNPLLEPMPPSADPCVPTIVRVCTRPRPPPAC